MSGSVAHCWTIDRERAREMREAIAYGQRIAQQTAQAASSPSVSLPPADGGQSDDARLVYDENARRQIAQYAYNPPADIVGNVQPTSSASASGRVTFTYDPNAPKTEAVGPLGQPSQAPTTTGAPIPNMTGNGASGMTQDQFRASVNQSMQQFRQPDAQFRQGQASQLSPAMPAGRSSDGQLTFNENAPRSLNNGQNPQAYAPRNGYDAQGYRQDSPRSRYDDQGYRQDSPRNQYDAQGYRQDSPRSRYDDQGYRSDSPRPQYDPQGYRMDSTRPTPAGAAVQGDVTRFAYDPDGPRSAASGPVSRPSAAPVIPDVSRRAPGTVSQTAALEFPGR
jgi:hypothetical protein